MTSITLPTTIGSIVTFVSGEGADATRLVATLLAGAIENGEAHNVVWSDSWNEGEDTDCFTTEEILAGDPQILFEAPANPTFAPIDGAEVSRNYGEVVTYDEPDSMTDEPLRLTAIFAPGFVDALTGEFEDAHWVNSYGTYASQDTIEAGNPQVISIGWDEQN